MEQPEQVIQVDLNMANTLKVEKRTLLAAPKSVVVDVANVKVRLVSVLLVVHENVASLKDAAVPHWAVQMSSMLQKPSHCVYLKSRAE